MESRLKEDDKWTFESTDDLKNTLDGLVMMKKIQKSGSVFAGMEVELKARKATPNIADRHPNSDDNVKYPDWVTTEKDKFQYILSPDCPPLLRAKNLTYFEDNINNTGREIYDVLTSAVITHEVCIAPDNAKNCNYVVYHRKSNMGRGFGITIRDGKFRVFITHVNGSTEKFFDDYKELREWLLKNL